MEKKAKRPPKPENVEAGLRLEQTRHLLGFKTRIAFAEWLGLEKEKESTYRKWASGDNEIPLYIQNKLKSEKGIPSDWLMHNDRGKLPHDLYELLYPSK